ncbi:hypothetical protein BKA64DRAFT_479286 [Cadophora sp. MPI-SDFR-AT-0126]|nr:hypothetical protein BKA64DRAFT_479286 [Leotiomycetes sp. MPI-SDFR-AT-0126]
MSSIVGKLTAAVAAVQNENQLSLANLNFDFTLVKYEAPKEFGGVGAIISPQRRANAEEGVMHRTARKLGALFEGRLPPTTALFKAYGTRVSEISKDSTAGAVASEKTGIFGRQLGADCSSIWAAVTSGAEAIAIHLLACMLARTFTGPEATSVWVELVEKQKLLIMSEAEESMYVHKISSSVLAAQQEISRTDLGNWDSSARAWLQIADQVKERQQKQLMLILNNTDLPINTTNNVFESVMSAWKTALIAMDNLVKGIPQQVQDGAALLAISSWHLYPDLLVLGDKVVNVQQSDPVFEGMAVLTLGLQAVRSSQRGVSWSLPLACLRYYGQPAISIGSIGMENSRISMEQLGYVVLGCVMSSWRDFGMSVDHAAGWLESIWDLIQPAIIQDHSPREIQFHWLRCLKQAAQNVLGCDADDRQLANQLVALGSRNPGFIYNSGFGLPIFGLSDVSHFIPLLSTSEDGIELLRQHAFEANFNDESQIIRYPSPGINLSGSKPAKYGFNEFCTLSPKLGLLKRSYDGCLKATLPKASGHTRWIWIGRGHFAPCPRRSKVYTTSNDGIYAECWSCKEAKRQLACHVTGCAPNCSQFQHSQIWLRYEEILTSGEDCSLAFCRKRRGIFSSQANEDFVDSRNSEHAEHAEHEATQATIEVTDITLIDLRESTFESCFSQLRAYLLNQPSQSLSGRTPGSILTLGAPSNAAAFEVLGSHNSSSLFLQTSVHPELLKKFLVPDKIDRQKVLKFLQLTTERKPLTCYASAVDVYKLAHGGTITTKVLSSQISSHKWASRIYGYKNGDRDFCFLNRREAFACVAMFDSGACNLDPESLEHVFAMSSGNSLFVAGSLLCDPYERTEPNEIRRIIGNIGRAGISFLLKTPRPDIRERELENWKQINHHSFHGDLEDCFGETTIHLSFSGYELPLATQEDDRYIDRPANLVETLVSVHEKGKWIADLDINLSKGPSKLPFDTDIQRIRCAEHKSGQQYRDCQMRPKFTLDRLVRRYKLSEPICGDNWDEILDPPRSGILFARAHGNWLARFALSCVCKQLGFKTFLLPSEPCWSCLAHALFETTAEERLAAIL